MSFIILRLTILHDTCECEVRKRWKLRELGWRSEEGAGTCIIGVWTYRLTGDVWIYEEKEKRVDKGRCIKVDV